MGRVWQKSLVLSSFDVFQKPPYCTLYLCMILNSGVNHLAIIMDGNRRWAKERGLPAFEGHRAGYNQLKKAGQWCLDRGIGMLTVFAFSTENWKRTKEEVSYLMGLLEKALSDELEFFVQKGIRLKIVGRLSELRPSLQEAVLHAMETTKDFTGHTLCICLNYGGRPELVDAVKKLIASGKTAEEIDEAAIQSALYLPEMPDPDLVIRTSGEERLSGFLLWQSAYSELHWARCNWPDFGEKELDEALENYAQRQRRYGA